MSLSTLHVQLASSFPTEHTKGHSNYRGASFVSRWDDYKEDGEDATGVKSEEKQKDDSTLTFLHCFLFQLHAYGVCSAASDTSPLFLSLTLTPSRPPTLPLSTLRLRCGSQTEARGKIPAPKFRHCCLNKPPEWRRRLQPMGTRFGG